MTDSQRATAKRRIAKEAMQMRPRRLHLSVRERPVAGASRGSGRVKVSESGTVKEDCGAGEKRRERGGE
jgi:hypothetical protein